jgi:hypothetical protein
MPALVSVRKLNPGEVAVQVTVVTKQSLKDARVVLNGVQAPIAPCVQMCKINNGAYVWQLLMQFLQLVNRSELTLPT